MTFVEILDKGASEAQFIFFAASEKFTRDEFFSIEFDNGLHAGPGIYAYCVDGVPIYIGQTTRYIKVRLNTDQTSKHITKEWWPLWDSVLILPVHCKNTIVWLEAFLILTNRPKYNDKFNSDILEQLHKIEEENEEFTKPSELPTQA